MLLTTFFIWFFVYMPIHDRMPWSYKKWQARKDQGITIKRNKKEWE